jgi:TolA-binding protein
VTFDRHIFKSEASEFERRLLHAARDEVPSPELTRRMQMALGLKGAASLAPMVAKPVLSSIASFGGVVALVVAGVVGYRLTRPRPPAAAPVSAPTRAPAASATALETPLGSTPAERVEATANSAPASAVTARPAAAASSTPGLTPRSTAADAKHELREEIALIDAARAAVQSRSSVQALALLRRYETSYPRGAFSPEATVLRIEALAQSGQRAQAAALAQRFLSQYPDTPLAARVTRAVGSSAGTQ